MDLSTFNWEANPDQLDFFGIKSEQYQEQVVIDKAREPKKKENEESNEELQEEEEKSPVFESFTNSEEEQKISDKEVGKEIKKTPGRPAKQEPTNFIEQFNSFKTQGILKHMELEEDIEELDADSFKDYLEQDYEEEVSSRIEQWATQELDDDAQAFIKFKKDGGRTSDFFKAYSSGGATIKGDINDENFQDKVIRRQLQEEGWDKEEIEDRLDYYSKTDKKKSIAEKYYSKIEDKARKEAETLIKQQESNKKQQMQDKVDFSNAVKDSLNTYQEVKGLKITTKDKSTLFTFMTKENEKVGNRSITGFQRAYIEAVQDPEKLLALAKIFHSDFNMSEFEKKAQLEQSRKIKENLESRKGLRPTASSSSSLQGGKSLADLFE